MDLRNEENITVFEHPLIQHKISLLRDKKTGTNEFRKLVEEIAMLEGFEAMGDLELEDIEVETPIETCMTPMIAGRKLAIVPILRAGIGMVDGIHSLIPTAKVGHIGLYRNEETLEPQLYYAKFPPTLPNAIVFLVDPMLATGGSAVAAINILKSHGAKKIIYMGIVGVDQGINYLKEHHPDVDIYLASKDDRLNENCLLYTSPSPRDS